MNDTAFLDELYPEIEDEVRYQRDQILARSGAYQELAKGFGVRDYTSLFHQAKANAVRFKTGSEFKRTALGNGEFGSTTMCKILFAIHETVRTDDARQGLKSGFVKKYPPAGSNANRLWPC